MPLERITKLEKLAEQLLDIVTTLQQVADLRTQRANEVHDRIDQTLENIIEDAKLTRKDMVNMQHKLHTISNVIMGIADKVDELAEYMSILEANQEKMQASLTNPYNDTASK